LVLIGLHLEAGLLGKESYGIKSIWCSIPILGGRPGVGPKERYPQTLVARVEMRGERLWYLN